MLSLHFSKECQTSNSPHTCHNTVNFYFFYASSICSRIKAFNFIFWGLILLFVFLSSWIVCSWGMLGHTDRLSEELISSNDQILADPVSEFGEEEEESCSEQIVYSASFEELASSSIKYDTVIWLSISLLLVLAWGFGLLMLLYLPFRRYVLRKDLSSRRLYVTHNEVIYKVHMNTSVCTWCCITSLIEKWFFNFPSPLVKVSRPSYIPFWGTITIERRLPLSLVIDIIIEQGTHAGLTRLFSCILL